MQEKFINKLLCGNIFFVSLFLINKLKARIMSDLRVYCTIMSGDVICHRGGVFCSLSTTYELVDNHFYDINSCISPMNVGETCVYCP